MHDRRPAAEVVMGKNASPKADKTPQTSPEAPFTMFIQLDGRSPVPSQFRTAGNFTIIRLQSPAGLPDRITKLSPVPALLVSISLKSLPSSCYQVWTADKLIPNSHRSPLSFQCHRLRFPAKVLGRYCLRLRSLFCPSSGARRHRGGSRFWPCK